jgi:hypothetical protein
MKGGYIHNFAEMGEPTPAAICDTFLAGGVDNVRFKSSQWLSWNGKPKPGGYDTSPYAITNLDAVKARCDDFVDRGIRPIPWCVPMGLDVEAEAQFCARVANVAGALDFDVVPFFARVRDLAPDAELTLDFPARNTAWEWGKIKHAVELAAPYVDRLALQSYFGVGQADDAGARVAALGTGKPIDHIVTPPMLGPELAGLLARTAASRVLIWLARDMNADAYQRLKAINLVGEQPPGPPPDPAVGWDQPGFSDLRAKVGDAMGDPLGAAHPDSLGNVWQESANGGKAVWVNNLNRDVWIPTGQGEVVAL